MIIILTLIIIFILVLLFGFLFKLNDKFQENKETEIKKKSQMISERNFKNNIQLKFTSFIKEYKEMFDEFDEKKINQKSIGEIKKIVASNLAIFMDQPDYKQLKNREPESEIVQVCEELSKTSPVVWIKNNEGKLERLIKKYNEK